MNDITRSSPVDGHFVNDIIPEFLFITADFLFTPLLRWPDWWIEKDLVTIKGIFLLFFHLKTKYIRLCVLFLILRSINEESVLSSAVSKVTVPWLLAHNLKWTSYKLKQLYAIDAFFCILICMIPIHVSSKLLFSLISAWFSAAHELHQQLQFRFGY